MRRCMSRRNNPGYHSSLAPENVNYLQRAAYLFRSAHNSFLAKSHCLNFPCFFLCEKLRGWIWEMTKKKLRIGSWGPRTRKAFVASSPQDSQVAFLKVRWVFEACAQCLVWSSIVVLVLDGLFIQGLTTLFWTVPPSYRRSIWAVTMMKMLSGSWKNWRQIVLFVILATHVCNDMLRIRVCAGCESLLSEWYSDHVLYLMQSLQLFNTFLKFVESLWTLSQSCWRSLGLLRVRCKEVAKMAVDHFGGGMGVDWS